MQEIVRNRRGLESDKLLLEAINNRPGLSQYELTKKLDWQSGRVDGAIRRLVNGNQILIKSTQRNGRLVNLVYAKDSKSSNTIEVPTSLLQFENGTWLGSAFVYALDCTTIGIAGREMPEWKETACFTETTPIKKDKENIVLQIPEKFNRFYNLERKHKAVTVNGNAILITITGNIINEKKYPA